ncbi:MAG: alpha/beta fold hydrolase [Planctomycetes bacterium]|nr:alpha/beta fold hydrolase [Planctomycetota bacterium]
MKRTKWLLTVAAAAALAAGCSQTDHAAQLVQVDRVRSTQAYFFLPEPQELIKQGRISAHRQVNSGGVTLDVWVIRAKEQAGPARATVLVLHSFKGSKADFPFLGVGERLAKMGYDVILPDLRAHGRSTGKYFTYGVRERADLSAVLDECIAQCGLNPNVYVFGSMVSAMAAIELAAEDKRCRGVIVDTPAMDFRSLVRLAMPLAPDQDFYGVMAEAASTAEFDPAAASAVNAAARLTCPMLVMFGVLDAFSIPSQHVQLVYQAASGPKKLDMPAIPFLQDMLQKGLLIEDYIAAKIDDVISGRIPELNGNGPTTRQATWITEPPKPPATQRNEPVPDTNISEPVKPPATSTATPTPATRIGESDNPPPASTVPAIRPAIFQPMVLPKGL